MTRTATLVALIAMLAPAGALAQEPMTVERAVRETLARNAVLRGARATVEEDTAHVTEARSAWFPRISVAETWQRGNQPVFVFSSLLSASRFAAANFAIDALNHPDPVGFFRTTVSMEQVLFDGGSRGAAVRSATLRREMSRRSVDQAAADLAVAATEAFGRILAEDAGARAAAAGLEAAREDLRRAEARRDAGTATDADVLALSVHAADLEQRLIQLRGNAAVARANLNRLMGMAVDADYAAVEPTPVDSDPEAGTPLETLLAEADASRPEVLRAAAAERLASAAGRTARSAILPQVAAQAVVDVSGTRVADRTSAWLVGAELRWNLSLGGAEIAGMKAAAAARTRATAEADDARAAVHVEVVTALRQLESARARRTAGKADVDQARESERIIRDRFEAGMAGAADVLRASTAVLDAEARRTAAMVDAMVSAASLRRALGRNPE
jgi:outer membrane protein TolC